MSEEYIHMERQSAVSSYLRTKTGNMEERLAWIGVMVRSTYVPTGRSEFLVS